MRRLYAIAMMTVTIAVRYKVFLVLLVFLSFLLLFLPRMIVSDGTAEGYVTVFLTYSLRMVVVILSLATVWISCALICSEIEYKQIYFIGTKPVSRMMLWLGKWCGVLLLNGILLGCAAVSIYGVLVWKLHSKDFSAQDLSLLKEKTLVARKKIMPEMSVVQPDNGAASSGSLSSLTPQVRQQAHDREKQKTVALSRIMLPKKSLHQWVFKNITITRSPQHTLFIKYRFFAAEDTKKIVTLWRIGIPGKSDCFSQEIASTAGSVHEIELPSLAVTVDGTLSVTVINESNTTITFADQDSLYVVFKTGPFWLNYLLSMTILFMRLAVVSLLALMVSSFTTFPVAVFVSMSLWLMSLTSGFVASFHDIPLDVLRQEVLAGKMIAEPLSHFFRAAIKYLVLVLSHLQAYSPVSFLARGIEVSINMVFRAFVFLILVNGTLLAVCGIFLYHKREMAASSR